MACSNPSYFDSARNLLGYRVPISCGHCLSCKSDKITNWTKRLQYEYNLNSCSFVTFTYDDLHCHYNYGFYNKSLSRNHVHKFFDSLRHYLKRHYKYSSFNNELDRPLSFKWFLAGEYGDKFSRPHYHALIIGLSPAFMQNVVYKCWHFGSVDVKPVFTGAIRYVLKYFNKQQNGELNDIKYYDNGLTPPFISCSPGIGSDFYFNQLENICKYGCLKFGNKFVSIPPYWKKKLQFHCKSFLDTQKMRVKKQYSDSLLEMSKFGFSDYDSFMVWKTKVKEEQLVRSLRASGHQVDEYYKFGHKSYRLSNKINIHSLVNEALEV